MSNANEMTRLGTVLVCLFGLMGCDPDPTEPQTSPNGATAAQVDASRTDASTADATPTKKEEPVQIKYAEGPAPTPETILVEAGELKVTFADYEHVIKIGRLVGPKSPKEFPEMPAERLAIPSSQFTSTLGVLHRKFVAAQAAERKLKASDEEAAAWLAADPEFGFFGKLVGKPELATYLDQVGLSESEFLEVGRDEVLRRKLRDSLVEEITPAEVKNRYAYEATHVRLAVAMAINVPGPKELDTFIAENKDGIDAYFEKHKTKFRIPRKVRVDMLRPATDQSPDLSVLDRAAKMLAKGKGSAEVAKELNLELKEGVTLLKEENATAFRADSGVTGFEARGPRGVYAWIVRGFYSSYIPDLTRPMRRQVAAEMMRRETLVPGVSEKLKKARKIMRKLGDGSDPKRVQSIQDKVLALGLKFKILGPINKSPNGALPEFDLAPEVVEVAFKLKPKRTSKKPVLSRERGFVVHVLERADPDMSEWKVRKDEFMKRYRDEARPTIVDRYTQAGLSKLEPKFDLNPLAIKYGTFKK